MDKDVILLKLGGSIITDKSKPYIFRPDIVRNLAREIEKANVPVIISHGSGSFGHTSAQKYGGKKGYKSAYGIAKVSYDAMEINRLVMQILIEKKLPAVSVRPSSLLITREGKIQRENFEIIPELLNQGLIPVIYGDVIWDKKWKSTIYSGETTLGKIADYLIRNKISVSKVVQVGVTDGVYDAEGKTIPEISSKNYPKIKSLLFKNSGADVTGGMQHKIEEAIKIGRMGIKTVIINGIKKNNLLKTLSSEKANGTTIS